MWQASPAPVKETHVTYQDLLYQLYELSPAQRQQNVTVELEYDEFMPITRLAFSDDKNDVLDTGHAYLTGFDQDDSV
jgi:hypothetical protein